MTDKLVLLLGEIEKIKLLLNEYLIPLEIKGIIFNPYFFDELIDSPTASVIDRKLEGETIRNLVGVPLKIDIDQEADYKLIMERVDK